jgi:hypothetical protein
MLRCATVVLLVYCSQYICISYVETKPISLRNACTSIQLFVLEYEVEKPGIHKNPFGSSLLVQSLGKSFILVRAPIQYVRFVVQLMYEYSSLSYLVRGVVIGKAHPNYPLRMILGPEMSIDERRNNMTPVRAPISGEDDPYQQVLVEDSHGHQ